MMGSLAPGATANATSVVGSVLFTDLVGFTDFNEGRGDVVALHVLDRQRSIVVVILLLSLDSRVV